MNCKIFINDAYLIMFACPFCNIHDTVTFNDTGFPIIKCAVCNAFCLLKITNECLLTINNYDGTIVHQIYNNFLHQYRSGDNYIIPLVKFKSIVSEYNIEVCDDYNIGKKIYTSNALCDIEYSGGKETIKVIF